MTVFPCGANGSPNFCPNVCQYGKFCKIKEKKEKKTDTKPRELSSEQLLDDSPEDELKEDDFKIETY